MVSVNLDSQLEVDLRKFQDELNHKTFTQTIEHFLRMGIKAHNDHKQRMNIDVSEIHNQMIKANVDLAELRAKVNKMESLLLQVVEDVASYHSE